MKLVTLTSEPGRRLKPDDVIALEVDGLGGACAIASSGYRDMTDSEKQKKGVNDEKADPPRGDRT
jgi:hypothetical protein